jgi:hypothetical protein
MADRRSVLLVEGRDDREVVFQFCNRRGIANRDFFDVHASEGYPNIRLDLCVRVKTGPPMVGAVFDADADLSLRWREMASALRALGYEVPEMPTAGGTLLAAPAGSSYSSVALWLMPDNHVAGMLEDFLQMLVPPGDALLSHAQGVVDCLPERRFDALHRSKAVVHTWLAWQEEPGTPLGLAITRKYLDAGSEVGASFEAWLRSAFQIPQSTAR